MNEHDRKQSSAEPGLSILLDDLLKCRSSYGDLAVARPLTNTERRHLSEARQDIEVIGLERNLVPWPINHEPSLRKIAESFAIVPHVTVDPHDWLGTYAFYFAFVPLRVTDRRFKRALITLRSDLSTAPETGEPALFLDLYPKSKRVRDGEVTLNFTTMLDLQAVAASAGIEGHINTKLALSYNFERAWSKVEIEVSPPPTAEAEWRIADTEVLSKEVQALAFILQVPRRMKTCKISHSVRLQFNSPPWEKTIRKWLAEIESRLLDIPEPRRRHISLLDSYVKTSWWSAEYREQEMIWDIDLTHHRGVSPGSLAST
jgi:hypothetical protein